MTLDEMVPIAPQELERAQGETGRDFVLDTVRKFLDVDKDLWELSDVFARVVYSTRPRTATFGVPRRGPRLSSATQLQFAVGSPDSRFADELSQRALGVRAWSNLPPYLYGGGEMVLTGGNAALGQSFLFSAGADIATYTAFTPSPSGVLADTWIAEVQSLLDPDEVGVLVDEAVVRRAIAFLRACPDTGPRSEFSASGREDGDIMLTWSVGYCALLSVLITADRRLVYSVLLPRGHDTEQAQGELPWIPTDGLPPVVETCFELFADAAA